MLVPLIIALILAILIKRTGKKFQTPSTLPTTISVLLFMFITFATRGAIKIRPNEITKGIVLAILMYLGIALIIYIGTFMWMKMKSPQVMKWDGAVSKGVLRFRTLIGIGGKSIEWLNPLGLFLGFLVIGVVMLLRIGSGAVFFQHVVQNAVLVGFLILGLYFLRNFHYTFIALVVALLYGGLNFLILSLIRPTMFLDFVVEFVFVFVFIVVTIWLLDLMRNPWITLGLGFFLASLASSLAIPVYMLITAPDYDVVKNFLLNPIWFWQVLNSMVIAGVMFGFYKTLNLNVDPSTSETHELKDSDKRPECAECGHRFKWDEAYKCQNTPGSAPFTPDGYGDDVARTFCPSCGKIVVQWHINIVKDYDEWSWFGGNARINLGRPLPPSFLAQWGKSIPQKLLPNYNEEKLDIDKLKQFTTEEERRRREVLEKERESKEKNGIDWSKVSDFYNFAGTLKLKGDFLGAEKAYRLSIEGNPNFVAAHNGLGLLLKGQERYDESVDIFKKAIVDNPDNGIAFQNLANLLIDLDRLEEAESIYKKSKEIAPEHPITISIKNALEAKKAKNDTGD